MTTLKEILAFILKDYPEYRQSDLSNARVTKMIYLADWHHAINHGQQITNINWRFDNYGPYVNDVKEEAEKNPTLFNVKISNNMYGQTKVMFELKDDTYNPVLSKSAIESLGHVIKETQNMYWNSFIKLVYSTYPITSSDRYSNLDLIEKAAEYKQQMTELA